MEADNNSPCICTNSIKMRKQLCFSLSLTGIFFVIGIIGVFHHEMWRDEYQAWLVAQQSHTIIDLWNNTQYEGHALLWHFLLFVVTQFTQNPLAMQLLHMILATIAVWIMTFYSPFTKLQRTLLVFGYFFLYEYAIISRCYVLTVLLVFIIISLFNASSKRPIVFSIILFLLANTSVFGIIFSSLFMSLSIYQFITDRQSDKRFPPWNWRQLIAIGIFISGVLFSIYSIQRGSHTSFSSSAMRWQGGLNVDRLELTLTRILAVFIPIPNTLHVGFWNTSIAFDLSPTIRIAEAICLIGFFFVCFLDKKHIAVFWGTGVLGIGTLVYFLLIHAIRYEGHIFLLLVSSLWLKKVGDSCGDIRESPKVRRWVQMDDWMFIVILTLQVVAGFTAYYQDIRFPFSNCNATGRYLVKNDFSQCLFGSIDFIVSPLTALTHKPIYYPESNSIGTYIIWDDKRELSPLSLELILEKAVQFVRQCHDPAIIVISSPLIEIHDQQLTTDVHITFLQKFDTPCVVGDEIYYIYRLSLSPIKVGEK